MDRPAFAPHQAHPTSTERPWRRVLRLSLRGLMVLILIVGGLLGWQARRASI